METMSAVVFLCSYIVHEFAQVMGIFVSGPKLQVLRAVLWLMNKDYVWEVSI
jgi:hypothetical protein